jgi:Fe-Mn family superoxide dismutase
VKKADGSLAVTNTIGAQTPLTGSDKPLLTVDVWEHAYYIDYRNQRPKFVESCLAHLVNWPFAASNSRNDRPYRLAIRRPVMHLFNSKEVLP